MTAEDALHHVPGIDVVVRGEGEAALPEVLDAHFCRDDLSAVPGISFRDGNGRIESNTTRPLNSELNALPWPAWGLFSLDSYIGLLEGAPDT